MKKTDVPKVTTVASVMAASDIRRGLKLAPVNSLMMRLFGLRNAFFSLMAQ